MRETIISNCEKKFVQRALRERLRLDGRDFNEYRNLKLHFGEDWGCAYVSLGQTQVLAQVSCELTEPKTARPNEGQFFINAEFGPMAGAQFEAGRSSDASIHVTRTLERTFRESRCIDLEALCITAEERAWAVRVDLNLLNYEGNPLDCCSFATLAALMHFRYPQVTVEEEDTIRIHTEAEKEFLPLQFHHYPLCVTFGVFDHYDIIFVDPSYSEERVCDSQIIFGVNTYDEICCLNLIGTALTSKEVIIKCARRADAHSKAKVEFVKKAVEAHMAERMPGKEIGLAATLLKEKDCIEDTLLLKLRGFSLQAVKVEAAEKIENKEADEAANEQKTPKEQQKYTAINWLPVPDEDDSNDYDNDESDNIDATSDDDDEIVVDPSTAEAAKKANHPEDADTSANKTARSYNDISLYLAQQRALSDRVEAKYSDSEEEEEVIVL